MATQKRIKNTSYRKDRKEIEGKRDVISSLWKCVIGIGPAIRKMRDDLYQFYIMATEPLSYEMPTEP
ncbi:MAG: hypothetical protein RDV48_24910 [Candidatus Eremiobacteraeota bacterium]|nr:hypothetical protein [Candidatus Eremiobacteraeota bacterium]